MGFSVTLSPARGPAACGEEEQGSANSFRRQAETELSGLCDDDMQEQGISKILTINLNDMAKELKIK